MRSGFLHVMMFAAICVSSHRASADEPVGRYQMIVTENNAGVSSALIVDTRDGHLWEWTKSHPIGQVPKEWIVYVGKMIPGKGTMEPGTR
jgi:hypothetical protein